MNKINLNRREIERVYEMFNKMNESGDIGSVILMQKDINGIGSSLTATFYVTHKDEEGEFTIDITNERDW